MEVRKYLQRIGISENVELKPDIKLLKLLQYMHVTKVPYENLDILEKKSPCLDIPYLYEKIVTKHRGGYCFELNALFAALLKELGYEVKSYFARYLRGESTLPMRRHRVLVVKAEGKDYLCDVGIGDVAPRYPLLMEYSLEQQFEDEFYRIERDEFLGTVLWEKYKGQWRKYFSFTDDLCDELDFIQPDFYCRYHPDSPFNKDNIVALKTPDGRKTLDGCIYKEFLLGELKVITEIKRDEIPMLLKEKFGLE